MTEKIAVLGPEGTFTEIAAKKISNGEIVYCDSVEEVFEKVDTKECDSGVVALENSIEGSVNITMDCLIEYDVKIIREIILPINLNLMSLNGKIDEIKKIVSHPHALAQCRKFLKKCGKIKIEAVESNSAGMKKASENKEIAAIGAIECEKIYGLKAIEKNINDYKSQTRFIEITKEPIKKAQGKKTSIIFMVKDKPSALYNVLKEFADEKINLKKIESRPSKGKLGEYFFFIDFEGNIYDKKIKKILERIRDEEKTTFLKILGSY